MRQSCPHPPAASPSPITASPSATTQQKLPPATANRTLCPDTPAETLNALSTLKPLGQLRDSFILAANDEGLWIIDQHVAHERVPLRKNPARPRGRASATPAPAHVLSSIDLLPAQMVSFAAIARRARPQRLRGRNRVGPRTLAIKAAPVGLGEAASWSGDARRSPRRPRRRSANRERRDPPPPHRRFHRLPRRHQGQHAASNPPSIDWLLAELGKTEQPPPCCPHGRPIRIAVFS